MAQYTPVLAAEYNSIQLDVTKVLGDRVADTSARAWGYGAATSSTSVVVGQRITASEWGLLAQDVRSAYWYQTGGDYGVPANVVQGNKVFWANVVSYQNAASTIVSNAGSTTVGASNRATAYYTDRTLAAWTGFSTYTISRKYEFASGTVMRYFFNAGGILYNTITTSGSPASGTKDAAYAALCSSGLDTFSRAEWISTGGLSGLDGSTRVKTVTTGDTLPSDAYTATVPDKISVVTIWTANNTNGWVSVDVVIIDEDTLTTDGVTVAPFIGLSTTMSNYATYPNGSQPVDGSSSAIPGTVPVQVAYPTITGNGPASTDNWY